jgi:hypothetical protein
VLMVGGQVHAARGGRGVKPDIISFERRGGVIIA